nr:unnamed protein product [Callosobruchus analis]
MFSIDTADEGANISLPGTSTTVSPPRKRQKKGHLNLQAKEIVLNVFKSEFLENPGVSIHEIEKIIAKKTGVSARTVFSIRKGYKESHTLSEPRKPTEYKKISHTVDDFDRNAIRCKVHQFFFRNELPTIDKVLKEVKDDPDLPNFKRTTFYKLLKLLNF